MPTMTPLSSNLTNAVSFVSGGPGKLNVAVSSFGGEDPYEH